MKKTLLLYLKLFSIYFVFSLVCASILSVFDYFHLMNFIPFEKLAYFFSILMLCILCVYLLNKIEKKAYLHVIAFLGIYFLIALCFLPFLSNSLLYTFAKVFIAILVSLFFLLRK